MMLNLEKTRRSIAGCVTQPIVRLLAKTPLTPNALTWVGFLLTVGAAVLIVTEHLVAAGATVIVAGLFDMLDGALARTTGQTSKFGAILDSTLDRMSEAVLMLGLLAMFAWNGQTWESFLAGVALLGSFMVSYIRARVEGMGIECKAGFFTRPERVIILVLGLLLSGVQYALVIALALIAFLSLVSAGERLVYARRRTKE
ncbi:MAG: CDP-alcohol phosphatidyltransferase family protein [Dehalococcoidales bacterium]|nr:CDP-alcohol phosphatidyltransferase family protein [Dehalococcoidales bacterium]